MKIAFDVDGVVLKSIDVILEYVNKKTGRNIKVDHLTTWDLEPLGLDLKTLWEAVDHMYTSPRVEPYSRAMEVLLRIHLTTKEPLLFITGRADPETAQRHLEALPWNSSMPEMIVCGGNRDKREYLIQNSVDFIVEDDVRHIDDYLKAGFGVGLMVRPWNRSAATSVTARFESWAEIERWFMSIWRKYEKR
jgi:uncharacterized HAD superfamily protein